MPIPVQENELRQFLLSGNFEAAVAHLKKECKSFTGDNLHFYHLLCFIDALCPAAHDPEKRFNKNEAYRMAYMKKIQDNFPTTQYADKKLFDRQINEIYQRNIQNSLSTLNAATKHFRNNFADYLQKRFASDEIISIFQNHLSKNEVNINKEPNKLAGDTHKQYIRLIENLKDLLIVKATLNKKNSMPKIFESATRVVEEKNKLSASELPKESADHNNQEASPPLVEQEQYFSSTTFSEDKRSDLEGMRQNQKNGTLTTPVSSTTQNIVRALVQKDLNHPDKPGKEFVHPRDLDEPYYNIHAPKGIPPYMPVQPAELPLRQAPLRIITSEPPQPLPQQPHQRTIFLMPNKKESPSFFKPSAPQDRPSLLPTPPRVKLALGNLPRKRG